MKKELLSSYDKTTAVQLFCNTQLKKKKSSQPKHLHQRLEKSELASNRISILSHTAIHHSHLVDTNCYYLTR